MIRYSIFTEFSYNVDAKNKEDLKALEEKLKESNIPISSTFANSIIIDYNGKINQFRPVILDAISKIERKSQRPIYIAQYLKEM